MDKTQSPRKKDSSQSQYASVQRSLDIFIRLTNLSMEWNMIRLTGPFVSQSEKEKYWDSMHQKMAQSILTNIKSLKGCWVKLGQFLSTKTGYLPRYYLEAFSQLQDYMPTSDFGEIIETIEEDLGFMDEIYSNFETIPIASASIAQVHKAKLLDGSVVAVKVQHKSSEQNLTNDIEILKMITNMMHTAGIYPDIRDYFEEYSSYAVKELDFTVESNNIHQSLQDVYESKVPVKVPRLHQEYCSRHVITMEFVVLNKFTDEEFLEKYKPNMTKLIYDVHDFAFFQVTNCGRLHSDPHPGNLQLTYDPKDKTVYPVFLDWGFTTFITEPQRIGLCKLYKSIYTYDKIGLVSAMLEAGFVLRNIYPYRYDLVYTSFIGILTSSYKVSTAVDLKGADLNVSRIQQSKLQELVHEFLLKYFKKAPNFVPLSFKVLSEYQSLSRTVGAFAPFVHLMYKNSSYGLYSLYDSPLNSYYSTLGHTLLQYKLNCLKKKLLRKGRKYSFYDIVERLSNDSLKRNKNFRIFSELILQESKSFLESRLADLFRHLLLDSSNLISFQVAVINNGSIEAEVSFGNIDKYEKRPISNESLFPLFTISSGLLTIAILHLASIGKIGLDDRVHAYWPEFKKNKEFVTIRDILEHRCGVLYLDYPFFDILSSREMMCTCVENAKFFFHNNSGADYMFLFYGFILSEIITRVTTVPTEEYVLMLASMVGIDNSNFLFPNTTPSDKTKDSHSSDSESSSQEDSSESDEYLGFTKSLNSLFEQSVSVFGKNLPIMNLFNISYDNSLFTPKKESNPSSELHSDEKDNSGYSTPKIESASSTEKGSPRDMGKVKRSKQDESQWDNFDNFQYSESETDANLPEEVKFMSLDDNCLDSNLRKMNLDIDSYRKNLSFTSNVIDIPRDDKGEIDSTYYCYCHKYDQDFPEAEHKRCYVPTKYCPTPNRLVRLFRGSSEDRLFPLFTFVKPQEPSHPIDTDYCSTFHREHKTRTTSEENISSRIRESFKKTFSNLSEMHKRIKLKDAKKQSEESESPQNNDEESDPTDYRHSPSGTTRKGAHSIGTMGKLIKVRNKVCFSRGSLVNLDGYTLSDLVRFNSTFLDLINVNYPQFYQNSVPFLNARSNAFSLSFFYYSVLSGSLVSQDLLNQVMAHNLDDQSVLSRFFLGLFKPCFSLGFQKFSFVGTDNRVYQGFGHSDVSGSVVMGIPSLNLSIAVFVSHGSRFHVLIKVLQFILDHYGLKLLGYNLLDSNLFKVLSCL